MSAYVRDYRIEPAGMTITVTRGRRSDDTYTPLSEVPRRSDIPPDLREALRRWLDGE